MAPLIGWFASMPQRFHRRNVRVPLLTPLLLKYHLLRDFDLKAELIRLLALLPVEKA